MALDIGAILAGLFLGTMLERRMMGQRLKLSLLIGTVICLIGFLACFVTRGSALEPMSMLIVFLGVPTFSNGLLLLGAGRKNK